MATFVVGDIHAHLAALTDLLDKVTPLLQPDDTIVFLGDYIDRGPDARGCIERILQLRQHTSAKVVTLLGNHEDWLLRSFKDPAKHSGDVTPGSVIRSSMAANRAALPWNAEYFSEAPVSQEDC